MRNLSSKVIGSALEVHGTLGSGFLESVYAKALACELRFHHVPFQGQVPYTVMYRGSVVGTYVADLIVDRRLVVELKAARTICPAHEAQLINYLKASRLCAGLLLNFGAQSLEIKRLVHCHDDASPA